MVGLAAILMIVLQCTPMLPTKIQVNWPFHSGEDTKNRFSRWWPFCISDQNDFSYFWSTSHPKTSYQVSRGEVKNGLSRWPSWWPSWISDWNDFSYFWSTLNVKKIPDVSYQVSSQMAQGCRRSRLLIESKLLMPHNWPRTTDTDQSQQLTLCAQVS